MKKVFATLAILFGCLVLPYQAAMNRSAPESGFSIGRLEVTNETSWISTWPDYFPRNPPWHHDFPDGDDLLANMLRDRTGVEVASDPLQVVRLDSPDVFQYPFVYLSEPGYLDLSDQEIANLGEYIRRGGFIMVDDFRTGRMFNRPVDDLTVLRRYLKQAVPEMTLQQLDVKHPIFHSFFDIDSLDMKPPYDIPEPPQFWGLVDDSGRLSLIASYNNDLGDFWKYLDMRDKPLKDSAKGVRLGINYVIYSLSH